MKRAALISEILERESTIIVQRMAASDDETTRTCAAYVDAAQVVKGLAWQLYKRIEQYENVSTVAAKQQAAWPRAVVWPDGDPGARDGPGRPPGAC